ncbi:tetratricopeptide repeat protein [Anaeromyxobacter oryzae]|uniref:Tetratricopeptide repeat protein n=1 Tax=Anaeromyxobacter oryzae TaxID=2918170 RepID=A0ABN6MJ10_9BACT|nr:tetratricopeptide repeat protein [Anaeromyxobacter oryzae]BDG01024.1 hypothetical protein AMOR_00200 [Anaeromyxobacter oryzae]
MRSVRPVLLAVIVTFGAPACVTGQRAAPASAAPTPGAPAAIPGRSAAEALAEGEAALQVGKYQAAEAAFDEASRLDPSNERPRALRAVAVFRSARFDAALALAQESIARRETYDARLVEAGVLAIRRRFEDAARSFERCAALEPASAEAWSALVGVRLALGETDGAEQAWASLVGVTTPADAEDRVWTDVQRMQPDPFQVEEALDRCSRGTAASIRGNQPEAHHELMAVLGTVPTYAHCWSELGRVHWKMGQLEDAERSFRTALAAYRPDQTPLRGDTEALLAALLLERKGDGAEAVRLARAALQHRGERPATVALLARACAAAGDASCSGAADGDASRAVPAASR